MASPPLPPSSRCSRPPSEVTTEVVGLDGLVVRLAVEMRHRWEQGKRPLAEEFFARHPELRDRPEAAIDLVYEEICLRQEHHETLVEADLLRRFPLWQSRLQVLLRFHEVLGGQPEASFPKVGECWGDFRLLSELGRGGQGRVFLATQPSLAERPIVLKLTPCEGGEHLTLARLQHTHIVPLYFVQDDAARNLRALCMPYYGGANLEQLLQALRATPCGQRTGRHLLEVLDQIQSAAPVALPARGPSRHFLAHASYERAVCGLGLWLAEALHYAHERGLLHLDLKPSNVLLTADALPMLLDFHLARGALRAGDPPPDWLGGTPLYMSPEQKQALAAVRQGQRLTLPVDARSDVFSLGLVLFETLAGQRPQDNEPVARQLRRSNPRVQMGLADVLARCLKANPEERYADAASLAADLRRHLDDEPLRGVANRSLAERWHKWRRRRPMALLQIEFLLLFVAVGFLVGVYLLQLRDSAQNALREAEPLMTKQHHEAAIARLRHGQSQARWLPGHRALKDALAEQLRQAERGRVEQLRAEATDQLHRLANQVRFLYGLESLPVTRLGALERQCRAVWEKRKEIVERLDAGPDTEPRIRNDLLDLAILWTQLRVRLATAAEVHGVRREALKVLTEAEALFGPNVVLVRERQSHAEALGEKELARQTGEQAAELSPRTAWEHYALGRWLLEAGRLDEAADQLERAVASEPAGLWPNFYHGLCAYRLGRFDDAVIAFTACVGQAPRSADCFFNRALAHAALDRTQRALSDYDHALTLDPNLAPAWLNRGLLHYREKRYPAASRDLKRALETGADPAAVHCHLALVCLAQDDRSAARSHLQRALDIDPEHREARQMLHGLRW